VCDGDIREALAGAELRTERVLGDADVRGRRGQEARATEVAVVLDRERHVARERRHDRGRDVGRAEGRRGDPAGEEERDARTDECLVEMLHTFAFLRGRCRKNNTRAPHGT